MHQDPISDMITRIRNAVATHKEEVKIKASNICARIAQTMLEQGYILGYDRIETADKQGMLRIQLKYGSSGEQVIREIRRFSKPSCRVYRKVNELPRVMGGLGVALVSTSQGVLTDHQCRQKNIGGELLCTIC